MDADKTEVLEGGYITIRTVYKGEVDVIYDMFQHSDEWKEIDDLVFKYQEQFKEDATEEAKLEARKAGGQLIEKFRPLFKKYVILLRTGQINFKNSEQKQFVGLFINDTYLKRGLKMKHIHRDVQEQIISKFNFLIEGYGKQEEQEILGDLQTILFTLAKRYKDVGKSYCCYVYNLFKYEVCRMIQKYQKNPANIHYKVATLNEYIHSEQDKYEMPDNIICEDEMGLPDRSWLNGDTCSDIFFNFSKTDRLIFSKYYLQDWNDSQIADLLGMHLNTLNQRRKAIVKRLCEELGYDYSRIRRHRKSGKKAILNTAN